MNRVISGIIVVLTSGTVVAGQGMSGSQRAESEKALEALLLGKVFIAKTAFPGWKDGIDLSIDGKWNNRWATRSIKDHGVGIETGDRASVTAVKVKDKHIEFHLNGGGAGTLMDSLMVSDAKKALRESSGGKVPGGSRINLRFDRPLAPADTADLGQLAAYLEPLVDASSLQQAANRQSIPLEFKEAAARGDIVIGMDKATVFGIMGEPKSKNVDVTGDIPIEKWIFELKNLKTRVVTFAAGKVSKVDEF